MVKKKGVKKIVKVFKDLSEIVKDACTKHLKGNTGIHIGSASDMRNKKTKAKKRRKK